MSDFFFFGSLRDRDVLAAVLVGRADGTLLGPHLSFDEAALLGYRTHRVKDEDYPILLSEPGGRVPGVRVRGLRDEDLARIRYFEEAFYDPRPRAVEVAGMRAECLVFVSPDQGEDSGERWTYDHWSPHRRRVFALLAELFMACYGKMSFEEADAMWEEMVERAEAMAEEERAADDARAPVSEAL